jgi:hypothetical protein
MSTIHFSYVKYISNNVEKHGQNNKEQAMKLVPS